ncbi:MAG: glycosyltransferase family 2 protein [Armatimonadia bacterium]
MTLTVVVVSYNTVDLLRECLQSVFAHVPAEGLQVVVVDNASADASVQMVRDEFPQALMIANEANVGYAAAVNQGLRAVAADYALILNSDIEVRPGSVEEMQRVMAEDPEVGMAGPELVLPDGRVQETWGEGFSLGEFARQQLMVDKVWRKRGGVQAPALQPGALAYQEVAHLHGAALLVRGEALRDVGELDEGYFMYCEDSDWCLRLRRGGWKLAYVPGGRMMHHHGASSRQARAEMIAAYNLAAARYFRLHSGPLEGHTARALGLAGTSLRFVGAMLGTVVTLALYEPLRRRARLFFKALVLQKQWGERWLKGACVGEETSVKREI